MNAPLPGPRLPPSVQTALYWASPGRTVRRWQARHGDVFAASIAPMGQVVFLCKADDIKKLLRASTDDFRAGAANATLGGGSPNYSLLTADGTRHARARALLKPTFHGKAVHDQVERIAEIADEHMLTWPVDRPFALHQHTKKIALDVILRIVMGVNDDRMREIRAAMLHLTHSESALELILGSRTLAQILPFSRRREKHLNESKILLHELIAEHREDARLADRTDALALLVGARDEDGKPLSDQEISDQLITLLVAGYETTAAGLAWIVERLVRTPVILAAAVRAADTDDADYLDAVVKEGLRIRTVVADLSRMAMRETSFAGYHIPRGAIVTPCVDIVHESSTLFDDAAEFRPTRFLEDKTAAVNWMPFGGGIRRCIGATFALVETRIVLQRMLQHFSFDPVSKPDERVVRKHITAEPARGARVTLRLRESVALNA